MSLAKDMEMSLFTKVFGLDLFYYNMIIEKNQIMKGRRSRTDYLCTYVCTYLSIYVCLYPSSAHSFDQIVMKLGMDLPWDPKSVMG